ncbi:hypothetical protein ACWKWZ_15820 [Metapseudomonas otitidis]|jgi:hypothetical protein
MRVLKALLLPLSGTSKNVGEAVSARQKQAKKRSLRVVNEHFEPVFNAAMTTQVVFTGGLLLIITLIGLDRVHGPQPPSAQPERARP